MAHHREPRAHEPLPVIENDDVEQRVVRLPLLTRREYCAPIDELELIPVRGVTALGEGCHGRHPLHRQRHHRSHHRQRLRGCRLEEGDESPSDIAQSFRISRASVYRKVERHRTRRPRPAARPIDPDEEGACAMPRGGRRWKDKRNGQPTGGSPVPAPSASLRVERPPGASDRPPADLTPAYEFGPALPGDAYWVQPAQLVRCDITGCTFPAEVDGWQPLDLDDGGEWPWELCRAHQLAWTMRSVPQ